MTRQQSQQWLWGLLASHFNIRERPPCLQWMRDNITIPREVSPTHPGAFDPNIFPLANIVYEWFDDPRYRELVIPKSSQAGISQAFQNLTCMIADFRLGDVAWLFETATKARDVNNERFKPLLRAQRYLERVIPEDDDKMQNMKLLLNGLKVILAGAVAAGQVASRTVPYIFCDEGDEYPTELQGGESHAWTLIRERAKLIEHAKLALFSKPRNDLAPEVQDARLRNRKKKDDGIIWKEYLGGTRTKCLIPCVHQNCSEPFEIVWELIKFSHCRRGDGISWDFEKMLAETFIECPACKRPISDDDKVTQILKHRLFRDTNDGSDGENPPIPGRKSVHISDLYVNSREFPTLSIGALAVKFVSAKTQSDRRAFQRGNLATPITIGVTKKMEIEKIRRLCGQFERRTCPIIPAMRCTQIDVQDNGNVFKWVKLAFDGSNDDAYVLDHGFTEMSNEIATLMAQSIAIVEPSGDVMNPFKPTTRAFACNMGWIDEGDGKSLKTVLDLCITPKLFRKLSTCKGRGGRQTENMLDRVMLQENRSHEGLRLDRYLHDAWYFADELYDDRIGKWTDYLRKLQKGEDVIRPIEPRIHFYKGAPDDLLEEFCHERKDWHIVNGRLIFGWPTKPEGGHNDYADCVKDGLAMWYRMRILLAKDRARAAAEAAAASAPPH